MAAYFVSVISCVDVMLIFKQSEAFKLSKIASTSTSILHRDSPPAYPFKTRVEDVEAFALQLGFNFCSCKDCRHCQGQDDDGRSAQKTMVLLRIIKSLCMEYRTVKVIDNSHLHYHVIYALYEELFLQMFKATD